ncbi:hypothetical protein ERC79_10330 [Rhodococcus sp. ABRD24]|uniref:hypothetical protein n=1 Tax=Rhodococcus sp. ABRD24 TaxID=2507582 RepID=UPI00103D672F|nr:hypothetical protein [Rhodococcus sp. ABRD24]QBJ96321.1 hypothetical protein ERC79_10330 [Rhodococcus sp. ABRD24]
MDAIWAGATGGSQETAVLVFKEDPARVPSRPAARGNPDAEVAETLIDGCICFAIGSGGDAYVVLGVSDRRSGPDAFAGTVRDADWVEKKVFDKTVPNLRVVLRHLSHAPLMTLRQVATQTRDIVAATGADRRDVTQLTYLRQSGRAEKDPTGPSRGPGVRWLTPKR